MFLLVEPPTGPPPIWVVGTLPESIADRLRLKPTKRIVFSPFSVHVDDYLSLI